MVTLSLLLYRKKNLSAIALWMTSLAVARATPLRMEVPPVSRRALTLTDQQHRRSHHQNVPAPARRAGTAPFLMMDVVTSIEPHVFNRWSIGEHARKRPCGPLTRRYAPAAAKPCRDHSDRAQND